MAIPILTTVNPGGGATTSNITFYVSNAVVSQATQQVTVLQSPASNPGFNRSVQVSGEFLFIKRGTSTFAFPIADLAAIGASQVPGVSYSPLITLQPVAQSVVHGGSNHGSFSVAANSESTLSYRWNSNNGTAWSYNVATGGVYTVAGPLMNISVASNSPAAYSVFCTVVNATGQTNTATVQLTVT